MFLRNRRYCRAAGCYRRGWCGVDSATPSGDVAGCVDNVDVLEKRQKEEASEKANEYATDAGGAVRAVDMCARTWNCVDHNGDRREAGRLLE